MLAVVAALGAILLVLSRDASTTEDRGTGGFTGGDFHSMVVDPADPQRLFVGGHEAVSMSTDGGRSWNEIEQLRDADAMGWTFSSDAIYVSGHPGLSRSTDDALTFERINEGLPDTDVHAFGGTDEILYGSAPSVGVFAKVGGEEWQVRTESVGQSFFGRILVGPDDPDRLFAADAAAGVAASDDGARTWQLLDSGLPAASWVSRGGTAQDVLVGSGPAGAAVSLDGGETWRRIDTPNGVTIVEATSEDGLLYGGRHDGSNVEVFVSRDLGDSWSPVTDR